MAAPPRAFPNLGLPQVVTPIDDLLDEYVNRPEKLPVHTLANSLRHLPIGRDIEPLFAFHSRAYPLIQRVRRDPGTGKLIDYEEVETSSLAETAKNSLSLARAPQKDEGGRGIKGSSTNFPFWPGGFDDEKKVLEEDKGKRSEVLKIDEAEEELFKRLFEGEMLTTPPTCEKGMSLPDFSKTKTEDNSKVVVVEKTKTEEKANKEAVKVELEKTEDKDKDYIFAEDRRKGGLNFWSQGAGPLPGASAAKLGKTESKVKHLLSELSDDVFNIQDEDKPRNPILKISKSSSRAQPLFMPWAEMIDVTKPMLDFHEKVPDLAYKHPFELDIFQKQAIAKLEEHENVFVAAHTSAGKTAVAEYAIALSVQHMTRTIYTSPIKALSNQKFRDFKLTFDSVGLVTGDVQINPGASVLIMTTEILRSMLYNGSDVIRDLEWVVFDEIHYLNNEERGHVWEEVLIMLPPHVSIIMLSATVPNALQFANWVGEIKRKKIYVISTPKRPVPLEHILYTGSGGRTRDETFVIMNAEGNFLKQGYTDAKQAKEERKSKHEKTFGARGGRGGGGRGFNENTEKNTYIGLINHLKEQDKLPVVVFTFSRNRCDQYAQMMESVDLCTGEQKGQIHGFINKSISRLKGDDRELPQVLRFQAMLKNGIGVHHSGILPILKEVVEMLFQKGLVKLLFATETFAMGVNMPARTVVFDSIRKHDGMSFRSLNPAEYIQMAGRAGRRGLDTKGTVYILCKGSVPELEDLRSMMLGSAAKLSSQFRLTYSMILNLLRVESLTVEDVMKRSFLEAGARENIDQLKKKLAVVQRIAADLEWNHRFDEGLQEFVNKCKDFIGFRESMVDFLKAHSDHKHFQPGRVVLVEKLPKYCARLGLILESTTPKQRDRSLPNKFKVLILTSPDDYKTLEQRGFEVSNLLANIEELATVGEVMRGFETLFESCIYLSHSELTRFEPWFLDDQGCFAHTVVDVDYEDILEIMEKSPFSNRLDTNGIITSVQNWENPRLVNFNISPNMKQLLEALVSMYHSDLAYIPAARRIVKSNDFHPIKELINYEQMKVDLKRMNVMRTNSQFFKKFHEVFSYLKLQDVLKEIEFRLSPRSLKLHEEYQSRIKVLHLLGYIDKDNLVQMKGRVACEMGNQNELMVTEMVLDNMFATAPPAEVAAILSCLVFEAKNVEEPNFEGEPALRERVKQIKKLAGGIGLVQRDSGLKEPVDQYVEQFRFGLAEVVHEWAKGKSFRDIMKLTDVQEGLIVRTIQRLDEMIRDVKDAARIIGDPSLKKKMEESSECIKRDIVFAASLYTQ